ncbi:MAG: efflux RND transporter permease subunit [Gammaproteobacteria bacterium]|nr:efflux RND transporter permease subunit [Gammaproteobacteria bacterium]
MKKGLIAYFAGNRVAANLLMVFLIIGGLVAASQLSVQRSPEIDLRTITISVSSIGSTPKEVEQDILRRVEERIVGLSGVERVIAVASQGGGRVTIELTPFSDPDSVLIGVQNSIDGIDNFPPVSAEPPEIRLEKASPEVLTLAISSESADENELRLMAEKVRNELLELPNISQVRLLGIRDREITIELNEEQLRRHDLTFAKITKTIGRDSVNLSLGELQTDRGHIILQSLSKRTRGKEFEDIPLITQLDGSIVTLGDVATVRDGFANYQVLSELDGVPTAFARIDADHNQSVTEIAETVNSWLSNQTFPDQFKVSVWNDQATPAINRIKELVSSGVIGLILVFLCLVTIFDLRVATWITVGIPLSFIGAMLFFDVSGLTLNIATVFAFFLLIGIVVDDAVVVGESIASERQRGKNALDAAISGARMMVYPVTIGVLTTALALVPFLFVTEQRYQILNVIPVVAFFVLLVSLVEAFLILPAHLSHEKPWSLPPLRNIQTRISEGFDNMRAQLVAPIVSWSVRHVVLTPAIGAVVVILSLLLIGSGAVRVILFDHSRNLSDNIQAEIELPVGTPYSVTVDAARQVVLAAQQANAQTGGESVKSISVIAGAPALSAGDHAKYNSYHIASVRVHLNDRPSRLVSVWEFEQVWRKMIGDASVFERLEFQSARTRFPPNIAYSLRHEDREILKAATDDFKTSLSDERGIYGLTDNMALGPRQFEVALTPQGKLAGLTPASLGGQLRANFHGLEVQRIQRDQDEIKVVVRYPKEQRQHLGTLSEERIRGLGGNEIPLSLVADITESRELANLTSINGEKAAFVNGFTDASVVTPIEMRRKISESLIPDLLVKYPGLRIELDGGARNEISTLKTLGVLVPLVLLAMYLLVAGFLRCYWKPLVVVFGIPVAVAGAITGHWLLGWDFTAMSIFGVVGVMGVIVNDALVLLDRYNTLRREDPAIPAIVAASAAMQHRFRAVFLTSLTTVLGLSPLLYERSEELIFMVPFVVSMLGGLIFAGLFTLFILPTLVMLIEGRKE